MQVIRSIICEECKLPRRTKQWFDVCNGCVRNLPKARCVTCSRIVSKLHPDSLLCRRCALIFSKQTSICESCGLTDYPLISDPRLCRKCHRNSLHRSWMKSLRKKMVCCECGLTKACATRSEMICQACYNKRRYGELRCTFIGCSKSIENKKWQLCRRHNKDRLAPQRLSEYVKAYHSPFPQNESYFSVLTAKLRLTDYDGVTTIRGKDLIRYRAIGKYLQTYELPEVLTWQAIHEAMRKVSKRGRLKRKLIRSGLLELGNIYLQAGLLPSWESYLNEQRLDRYLKSTPAIFVEHVAVFERWAAQGMLNPKHEISLHESQPLAITTKSTLETVYAVVAFLNWCFKRNICALTDINESTVATYKESLFWQQECKVCRKRIPFDGDKRSEMCSNEECQAINSYVKIRRLARMSVTRFMMNLRTFFNWAQLHDVVQEHPVTYDTGRVPRGMFTVMNERGEMIEISDSIRRYDDDVVERLCRYMVAPDADPEEALVLYLIIFHLLTVTELSNAKIPSLAAETPPSDRDHAKDFEYLLVPVRERSRGRHTPRRDGPIMKYPKEAAYWLRPLLERYFEKRRSGRASEYLFVGQVRPSRNSMPVNPIHIWQLVHQASLRVLNGTINPRDLRGTVAAIRADMSKRRGAILTKLGYTGKRATRFNYLETFLLVTKTMSTKTAPAPSGGVAKRAVRGAPSARAKRGARGRTNKVAGV
jgi:hypothetical protein